MGHDSASWAFVRRRSIYHAPSIRSPAAHVRPVVVWCDGAAFLTQYRSYLASLPSRAPFTSGFFQAVRSPTLFKSAGLPT